LLDMLGLAPGGIGTHVAQTSVDLRAGETFTVIVTGVGTDPRSPEDGSGEVFARLRDKARQAEIAIEIGEIPGGTRLAWSLPRPPGSAR